MKILRLFIILLIIVGGLSCSRSESDKINVAVFNGSGASATCITETYEALRIDTDINPGFISSAEIASGKIEDFDVLIFPGGSGSKELNNLGDLAAQKVQDYVNAGYGVVGICAGGFLFSTTKDYPSLKLISATEWDREHYNKGRGLIEFELSSEGLDVFPELENTKSFLQYYDGPVFMPSDSGKSGQKEYTELATYVSDIVIHDNYPRGVTPGKTFLLNEKIGKGRAIVIAGHPESTPGMRWMVPRMVRWAAKKELLAYQSKWVRPEINQREIFFTSDRVKQEKKLFWRLLEGSESDKLDAMDQLYGLRSRPAVRWNLGLLRDENPTIRKRAAELLMETEYSAAITDLEFALSVEEHEDVSLAFQKAIVFLSEF